MPNFKPIDRLPTGLFFILFISAFLLIISPGRDKTSFAASINLNEGIVGLKTGISTLENPIKKIDLRDALLLALKRYPGIMTAKYSYKASVYAKNQSLYLYYPQISGTADFSKDSFMDVKNNGIISNRQISYRSGLNYSVRSYSGSINATYMLYSFGSRYYGYLNAKYQMKAAKSGYNYAVNSDLYNVILNFATYFENKNLMRADKENLKNDEIQYKAAATFYKVGTGDLLDVKTAKAAAEKAKATYISSIFHVKIARLALLNSIGLPASKKYRFINTLDFKSLQSKLAGLIRTALKSNPRLKQAIYALKASKASVRQAVSGYFPTVNVDLSYTGENSSFPLNRNYSMGLSVSIPIFNGFLTKNKIDGSKAALNGNIWNERLSRDNLIYNISSDYYAILSQYLKIKALKSSEKASKLAYKLALKGYEVGITPMVRLITANAAHISAETNYINSEYTYYYMKAKLYSDLGLMLKHYVKQKNIRDENEK